MALDTGRMRKDRDVADKRSEGGGAELWKLEGGEHLIWILPPVYEGVAVPYIEFECHYKFGESGKMVVNLAGLADDEKDIVRDLLDNKEAKVSWEEAQEGWERAGELARGSKTKRMQLRRQWMIPCMSMGYRKRKGDDWEKGKEEPVFLIVGKTIYDGLSDTIFDEGDITDPDNAIFLQVLKKGTGMNTKYTVKTDSETLKSPEEISDELLDKVEAWSKPGAEGDGYKLLSGWLKSEDTVESVWDGSYDDDNDDDDDDDDDRRSRKGRGRGRGRGRSRDDDDDDDEPRRGRGRSRRSRDDDDDKPKARKRRSRDDDNEEEKPKARKRRSRDDDDEEEEEKPRTESRRRSRKEKPAEEEEEAPGLPLGDAQEDPEDSKPEPEPESEPEDPADDDDEEDEADLKAQLRKRRTRKK